MGVGGVEPPSPQSPPSGSVSDICPSYRQYWLRIFCFVVLSTSIFCQTSASKVVHVLTSPVHFVTTHAEVLNFSKFPTLDSIKVTDNNLLYYNNYRVFYHFSTCLAVPCAHSVLVCLFLLSPPSCLFVFILTYHSASNRGHCPRQF